MPKAKDKGFVDLAEIRFKVDLSVQFSASELRVLNSVVSSNSGASNQLKSFPGYLIHPDQDYITVNRLESKWNMNLNSVEDLSALQFSFDYDTIIATIDSIVPDPTRLNDLTLSTNQPQPGNIKMVVNSLTNTSIPKGKGLLLSIFKTNKETESFDSINDFIVNRCSCPIFNSQ